MDRARVIGIGISLFLFSFSFALGFVASDTSEALAYCQVCNCDCFGMDDSGRLVSDHCVSVYCYQPWKVPDHPCGYWCDPPTR